MKEMIYQVTVPTKEGEITIMPKHMPLVAILVPGVIEIKKENGEVEIASVSGGFIEVLRNKVVLLADTAERAMDIDEKRAEEARIRATDNLKNIRQFDAEEYASISGAIAKELARTKAVIKWKKIRKP
ncbi:MAG: ATP synthase epsilon chain [Candidatus Falkowbacteria bacterium GW2011_GWC2_38_22]|uniref:ATP synthase epsilon chain n=1 Tax=Candidatus Falkowbacteria bacterium GW2011_GWE1_38_31 TaxID=1618638 RepID=A0A0G0K5P7_9BACT|nr:MAG: ATP synthase epsilon chain [Candidatus Falkowbacteria bacterium GW2011_GWF2_38_1205]KKQ61923.1 MAG: ATP synthase epsilon chain [Candidatus Falkowbacteria bacterium GW2011_GWC2_38_22]KKQ63915.1 MAG: ATP synthase epsilon chain [Candidatus Falkowbacteria bacterium GW2011_GWF1_38_22]KKQ66172.1 MAG: ATP synthase epsilon chain [Candidatus Falkowbacteria bacterium GW2011_GWE2_38_254]KKQ70775.1 MAG: ATP synthase epsilon chain [Candidatus Falkowbacteria bacterium GW2011_GWE1_38_31]KKQ73145.1 MA